MSQLTISDDFNPAVIHVYHHQVPDGQGELITLTYFVRTDGLMVGAVKPTGNATVGENPQAAVTREFITDADAVVWIKNRLREILGRQDVDFIDTPMPKVETPLVQRAGSIPGGGGRRLH